jgi:signal transduction histidine kinase
MNTYRFRLNLPFLALAASLILATAIASLLFARMTHDHIDANNHPTEDIAWPLFQVQAEYLRVRQLVADADLHPTEEAHEAALERYEILIGRLPIVTRSNIRQRLAQHPALQAQIDQIVARFEIIDRVVQKAASPADKIAILRQRLAAEADLIQRMVLTAHLFASAERDATHTTLHEGHQGLAALFAIVVLVVLIFAGVTWRQFRHIEQSRADLIHVSEVLEAEKERAVMASQAKSIFLANMSHELRTPLNAIIGFADMIAGQMLGPVSPPRYAEYAGDIHRSGQHLLSLVNDLLDLARIEAGRMNIEPEWLELRAECLAVVATFDTEARRAGIQLERVEVDPAMHVHVDQRALRQMLLNLVANAMKFTPVGGEIMLSAELADGSLRLKVRDSGPGISPELLRHLMEPFVRGAAQAVNGQQGTGLGLSITRRLMELHGGKLELESAPGQGTTAIMVFPPSAVLPSADNSQSPPAETAAAPKAEAA